MRPVSAYTLSTPLGPQTTSYMPLWTITPFFNIFTYSVMLSLRSRSPHSGETSHKEMTDLIDLNLKRESDSLPVPAEQSQAFFSVTDCFSALQVALKTVNCLIPHVHRRTAGYGYDFLLRGCSDADRAATKNQRLHQPPEYTRAFQELRPSSPVLSTYGKLQWGGATRYHRPLQPNVGSS